MSHMANKLVILDRDGTLNVDRDDYEIGRAHV